MIVKASLRELFSCRRRDGPVAGANFVQVIATQSAQGAKGRAPIEGAGHVVESIPVHDGLPLHLYPDSVI